MTASLQNDTFLRACLSEPTEYSGGELSIASEEGPLAIKAAAGDAVLYPSGSIHEVKKVETGVRLVAVTWLQSLVKSAEQRRILFDLGQSIDALASQGGSAAPLLQLRATHDALLRMWAEI